MEDPFSVLLNALQPMFRTAAIRNEKYTYPAVEQLKAATECYNPEVKSTFILLLKAIKEALPYIEKKGD